MKKAGHKVCREVILNMFGNCCFYCGSIKDLNIHHRDEINGNNTLNNIQVVCKKCHDKIHKDEFKKLAVKVKNESKKGEKTRWKKK